MVRHHQHVGAQRGIGFQQAAVQAHVSRRGGRDQHGHADRCQQQRYGSGTGRLPHRPRQGGQPHQHRCQPHHRLMRHHQHRHGERRRLCRGEQGQRRHQQADEGNRHRIGKRRYHRHLAEQQQRQRHQPDGHRPLRARRGGERGAQALPTSLRRSLLPRPGREENHRDRAEGQPEAGRHHCPRIQHQRHQRRPRQHHRGRGARAPHTAPAATHSIATVRSAGICMPASNPYVNAAATAATARLAAPATTAATAVAASARSRTSAATATLPPTPPCRQSW